MGKKNELPVLPKEVFVYFRELGSGEEYLDVARTAEGCAEKGEVVRVGVYQLVRLIDVTLEVKEETIIKDVK